MTFEVFFRNNEKLYEYKAEKLSDEKMKKDIKEFYAGCDHYNLQNGKPIEFAKGQVKLDEKDYIDHFLENRNNKIQTLELSQNDKEILEGAGFDLDDPIQLKKGIEVIYGDDKKISNSLPAGAKESIKDALKKNKDNRIEKIQEEDKYLEELQKLLQGDDIEIMQDAGFDPNNIQDIIGYLKSQERESELPEWTYDLKNELKKKGITLNEKELKENIELIKCTGYNLFDPKSMKLFVKAIFE